MSKIKDLIEGSAPAAPKPDASADKRRHLLARMAGNIASGMAGKHPPDYVATLSVAVAKRILELLESNP